MTQVALIADPDVPVDELTMAIWADALDRQLKEFCAAWGVPYTPVVFYKDASVLPGDGSIRIADVKMDLDAPGALGYHDVALGISYSRNLWQGEGATPSTISHEDVEEAADPLCSLWSPWDDDNEQATEACLAADTIIPLLNGKEVRIADLVGKSDVWVYSCAGGHVVPGLASNVRLTARNADVVRLLLDDGSSVTCTADHKFLRKDGIFSAAVDLREGDSMMPLYRRLHPIGSVSNEYEQVKDPSDGEWKFTHRIVMPDCPSGFVRHHADFNRFNNSPDNLKAMGWSDHQELHAKHVVEVTRSARERMMKDGSHPFLRPRTPEQRKQASEQITKYNRSDEHRKLASVLGPKNLLAMRDNPLAMAKMRAINGGRMIALNADPEHKRVLWDKTWGNPEWVRRTAERAKKMRQSPSAQEKLRAYYSNPESVRRFSEWGVRAMHSRWHERRGISKPGCSYCAPSNHKVISVTSAGKADVYDMTVEGHHNFAVGAGIFAHNCDRVEGDSYSVTGTVGGISRDVVLSNWLYPSAFDPAGKAPFDKMGKLTAWNGLTPGGYVILRSKSTGAINDVFARHRRMPRVVPASPASHAAIVARLGRPESRLYRRMFGNAAAASGA